MVGNCYGRLVVLSRNGSDKHQKTRWLCKCDCGKEITVTGVYLRKGDTRSCGCLKKDIATKRLTTHGKTNTPEHSTWRDMRKRCRNKKSKSYKNYGGRGIYVCEKWNSFESFLEDMGRKPSPGHTIERVDNNGPYSPDNCRWADRKEQMNNVRYNHMLTLNGQTRTMMEWSEITGINYSTLRNRVNVYGWSDEKALTTKGDARRIGARLQ